MKMKKRDNVEMAWLMVRGSCVFPAARSDGAAYRSDGAARRNDATPSANAMFLTNEDFDATLLP